MRQPPEKLDTGRSSSSWANPSPVSSRSARGAHRVGVRVRQLARGARRSPGRRASRQGALRARAECVSPSIAYSTAARSSAGVSCATCARRQCGGKVDVALVGVQLAVQQGEQARLARAVRADEADALAGIDARRRRPRAAAWRRAAGLRSKSGSQTGKSRDFTGYDSSMDRFPAATLERFTRRAFEAVDVPAQDAQTIAGLMSGPTCRARMATAYSGCRSTSGASRRRRQLAPEDPRRARARRDGARRRRQRHGTLVMSCRGEDRDREGARRRRPLGSACDGATTPARHRSTRGCRSRTA